MKLFVESLSITLNKDWLFWGVQIAMAETERPGKNKKLCNCYGYGCLVTFPSVFLVCF